MKCLSRLWTNCEKIMIHSVSDPINASKPDKHSWGEIEDRTWGDGRYHNGILTMQEIWSQAGKILLLEISRFWYFSQISFFPIIDGGFNRRSFQTGFYKLRYEAKQHFIKIWKDSIFTQSGRYVRYVQSHLDICFIATVPHLIIYINLINNFIDKVWFT